MARVRDLLRVAEGGAEGGDAGGAEGGDVEGVVAPAPVPGPAPLAGSASRWQRLTARVPVRLDPGRRAAFGVGLAVAIAAVVTAIWLSTQRPRSLAVPAAAPSIAGAASPVGSTVPVASLASAGPSAAPTVVVVDVAGKVRHPGLYRLPPGARVDDAVRRAGGPLRGVDLSSLNLAARVVDGQQILVGVPGAAPLGGTGSGGSPGAAADPVNLNAATLEQLESLPGVGPVLAQHIVDWRSAHGGFSTVQQLNDVPGIGEVKFADLHSLVTT